MMVVASPGVMDNMAKTMNVSTRITGINANNRLMM
jgi:hypothetical protein